MTQCNSKIRVFECEISEPYVLTRLIRLRFLTYIAKLTTCGKYYKA